MLFKKRFIMTIVLFFCKKAAEDDRCWPAWRWMSVIIVSTMVRDKTVPTVATGKLLTSHEFRNATRIIAPGNSTRFAKDRENAE